MCECARACCCCFWGVDIKDLAREYISGSNATGLALPWRFVGSAGQPNFLNDPNTTQIALPWVWLGSPASLQQAHFVNSPVLTRFTLVPPTANPHIKTLFLTKPAKGFGTVHEVRFHTHTGFPHARTVATTGETVPGPFLPPDRSFRPVDSVVELIHFEKSCAEHVFRRSFRGGGADIFRARPSGPGRAAAPAQAGAGAGAGAGTGPVAAAPAGVPPAAEALSAQSSPEMMATKVAQLRTAMTTKWPECTSATVSKRPVPMTALRDLWLAEMDAEYQATTRYQPMVVEVSVPTGA